MSRVAVIVVNYNGRRYLGKCLEHLEQQTFKDISVYVVDNGSSDGSPEYLKQHHSNLNLILLKKNVGFPAGNNIAMRQCDRELIALLNADAQPDREWIQKLVEAMDETPEAGFGASKMLYLNRPWIIDRAGDGYTRAGAGLLRGRGKSAKRYCASEFIFGACAGAAIYRKSMLDKIGLFDEDYFLLYEDVDLSFRAQLFGYKCIYVPDALVYHMASESIGYDSPLSVYYAHRNLEWTYIQNMPKKLLLKSIHLHLLYDTMAFIYFFEKGLSKVFLRSKIDALKGFARAISKRKTIQTKRKSSDPYIWSILEKEHYLNRLTHRFKKTP